MQLCSVWIHRPERRSRTGRKPIYDSCTMKNQLQLNLWKIALILGAIVVAIVVWGRNRNNPVPATPTPVAEVQFVTPAPSATPTSSMPISVADLSPSATPIPQTPTPAATPTFTPTPIPVYHTVQQGEAPLLIADKYGIAVDTLLEVNNITDPTLLQIGQQLLIPVTVTPTPSQPSPTPPPTATPIYHTVQAGDTLTGIAETYNTPVKVITLANDLSASQALQVGQELLIPPSSVDFNTPVVIHTVESGDTYDHLAFLYGSTIEDIVAANPNLEPAALRVGQQVIVPVTTPPVNPEANPRLAQITSPDPMPPKLVKLQQQMVDGTNAQRQTNGLPTLQADNELAQIALAHAQDMVRRGYFAHITPEGVNLRTRFAQHGVTANWIGENIQFNTESEDKTAAAAIEWLMNSAPHKANMLHDRFTHLGVGVAEEPAGWYTFVLVFAERQ